MSLERTKDYERAVSDLSQYVFNLGILFVNTYGHLPYNDTQPFIARLSELQGCLSRMTVGVPERYMDFKIKIPKFE